MEQQRGAVCAGLRAERAARRVQMCDRRRLSELKTSVETERGARTQAESDESIASNDFSIGRGYVQFNKILIRLVAHYTLEVHRRRPLQCAG